MKNIFKKYMPHPHTITENRWLAKLGPRIKDPNLWHLNRRSVSIGIAIGVFCAFIPGPIQIFVAVFMCFWARGNLPLSIASTWISNPLTYIPIYYFCYEVGVWFLGPPTGPDGNPVKVSVKGIDDLHRLADQLMSFGWDVIGTLLFGCTVVGIVCSLASFVSIRLLWRLHVYRALTRRRERHKQLKEK